MRNIISYIELPNYNVTTSPSQGTTLFIKQQVAQLIGKCN